MQTNLKQAVVLKNDCSDRSAEAGDQSGMGLVVGDRLKFVFYSRVGSGSDGANTGVSDLASLVEHPEMTGEYIVQLDGTIFLPLIGKVNAAGQGEESLVTILERKSKAIFHGPTNVMFYLVEREPVYVTGDVLQPGAFKYDPGMVFLNAVGLAGLHAAGPDLGARLDVVRELERLRESQIELADLLARRDVLVANRNGRTPTPSQDLSSSCRSIGRGGADRSREGRVGFGSGQTGKRTEDIERESGHVDPGKVLVNSRSE